MKRNTLDGNIELINTVIKENKRTKFAVVDEKTNMSLRCGSCDNVFGISNSFNGIVGETNFFFCCPYCRSESNI